MAPLITALWQFQKQGSGIHLNSLHDFRAEIGKVKAPRPVDPVAGLRYQTAIRSGARPCPPTPLPSR
jgi:hypothetical protein